MPERRASTEVGPPDTRHVIPEQFEHADTEAASAVCRGPRGPGRSGGCCQCVAFLRADPNGHSRGNKVLGVSHGKIFPVAKRFIEMPLADIDRLLGSPYYEVRMGAVSIMDFQALRETHFAGASQGSLRSVPPAS